MKWCPTSKFQAVLRKRDSLAASGTTKPCYGLSFSSPRPILASFLSWTPPPLLETSASSADSDSNSNSNSSSSRPMPMPMPAQ